MSYARLDAANLVHVLQEDYGSSTYTQCIPIQQQAPGGMKTSLGRGTLYLTISSLFFIASGYVIHVWLGNYLGPEDYGVYGVVIQVMTALNMIHYVGVPQAVSKYIAQGDSSADEILRSGLVLQVGSTLVIAVVFFLVAQPLALLLNDVTLTPYIRASSLVLVPYSAMTLYMTGYYNGLHYFKRQASMNIVYSIIKTVTVIGLVYVLRVYGAIIGFIISPLVAMLFGLHRPRTAGSHFPYRPLVRFSLPLILFSVLSTLQLSVDLFFVKALLANDASAGYYTANQNIARIPYFAFTGVSYVLLPSISSSVSRDHVEKTRVLISRSMRYVLLLLVPGTLLMSATSGQLLQVLYPREYLAGAGSLSILIVGLSFVTLFVMLINILTGAGRPGTSMLLAAGGLLVTSISCYLLVPAMGLNGAALATTLGGLLAMTVAGLLVYRRFHGLVSPLSALRILAASLVLYPLARLITLPTLLLPVLYVALFALYVLLLTLFGEVRREEWSRLYGTLLPRTPLLKPGRKGV